MWLNEEWKLISDLETSDDEKDFNPGYWYGKSHQYAYN